MADFTIECSDELMEKIEAIAFSETKIEVGGFLVGTYDENGAVVTEVLPARRRRSTSLAQRRGEAMRHPHVDRRRSRRHRHPGFAGQRPERKAPVQHHRRRHQRRRHRRTRARQLRCGHLHGNARACARPCIGGPGLRANGQTRRLGLLLDPQP